MYIQSFIQSKINSLSTPWLLNVYLTDLITVVPIDAVLENFWTIFTDQLYSEKHLQ